jgi:hypothetical protein
MGRRNLRWAIRALIALLAVVVLVGLVVELAPRDDVDPAERVVMAYVKARRAGDASKACEQLSNAERRELVARVSRTPLVKASGRDCERYVLQHSRWSSITRPALATFRVAGADAKRFADDVRLVRPSGFDLPVVEVWKRDREWKIDMHAAEGATFLRVCSGDSSRAGACECLFDSVRSSDPRVLDRRDGVLDLFRDFDSGRRRALFKGVVRHCQGEKPLRPSA